MDYVIDADNCVTITLDADSNSYLVQPNYPDGTPFATKADAENWAKAWIAHFQNPAKPDAPNGPSVTNK